MDRCTDVDDDGMKMESQDGEVFLEIIIIQMYSLL